MTAANHAIKIEHGAESLPSKHTFTPLPYDHDTLELHIDAETILLHYCHHHASCVAKRDWENEGGRLQAVDL